MLRILPQGGHIGFLGSDDAGGIRWADRCLVQWLAGDVRCRQRRIVRYNHKPLSCDSLELGLVDARELNQIAGPQWEIAVGHIHQDPRRPADEVPAAGTRFGVDACLPSGQSDTARLNTQARRR